MTNSRILSGTTLLNAGSALALIWSGAALAADDPVAATPSGSAETAEIVVTAQKREQRQIDVPATLTVLSAASLASAGVTDTLDLGQVTPGLTITVAVAPLQLNIRGVTSTAQATGDEPNIAVYVDGLYMPQARASLFQFLDVDHIEVLKGPQGTLFGRNSTGGAVLIVTKSPSDTLTINTHAAYDFGKFGSKEASLFVSGPLGNNVAASLSGFYQGNKDYIRSINPARPGFKVGKGDGGGVRGKVEWTPSDDTTILLAGAYSKSTDTAAPNASILDGVNVFLTRPGFGDYDSPRTYGGYFAGHRRIEMGMGSLTATHDFGDYTLKSITGYQKSISDIFGNAPVGALPFGAKYVTTQKMSSFSEELVLTSPTTGMFSWIVGGNFFRSEASGLLKVFFTDINAGELIDFRSGYRPDAETTALAAFGDATLKPTENIELTGGLRYSTEKRSVDFPGDGAPWQDSARFSKLTYRAIAKYIFSRNANVYASYSTGFKSGIYNSEIPLVDPTDSSSNLVRPEFIKALEIGAKARVMDVNLTAAFFLYDYTDIQQSRSNVTPTGGIVNLIENAASAKIRGFEFQADGNIVQRLSGRLGISYIPTARYEDYVATVITPNAVGVPGTQSNIDVSGSRMVRTPKWQVTAGLTYTTPLAGGEMQIGANYSYNSGFYYQPGNVTRQKDYATVDGRIGWTDPSEHFTLGVFGRNLTGADYTVGAVTTQASFTQAWSTPTEFGLFFDTKF